MAQLVPMVIAPTDTVLVTGATGFIGAKVVENLLERGFLRVRCFTRPSSSMAKLEALEAVYRGRATIEFLKGNLLRREDCTQAVQDVALVIHLAAGVSINSVPDAFMNTVVATRNLLDAVLMNQYLRRFVSVSSFAVYTNQKKPRWRLLDESCPVETHPEMRGDAYCYAKVKQDELVQEYGAKKKLPYVIVRPGSVYGPGKPGITGRVGINTFGVFLHVGGGNRIPFTYVDNCADALVLAGITPGIEGEVFNVVDDELPTSRTFLRRFKQEVRRFPSIYLPRVGSYLFWALWEKYSFWSNGQLPPTFNRRRWHAEIKGTRYSNEKLKTRLGWRPNVSMDEGLRRFFLSCREAEVHA